MEQTNKTCIVGGTTLKNNSSAVEHYINQHGVENQTRIHALKNICGYKLEFNSIRNYSCIVEVRKAIESATALVISLNI